MEMERINENTIRVSIKNSDLTERGITFLDLLGNQKQIESFFYSILEEVDVDEQFQETDSVTFQVLPNRDGLELFISKNVPMDGDEETFGELMSGDQAEDFADFISQQMTKDTSEHSNKTQNEPVKKEIYSIAFRLPDFEELITLANHVQLSGAETALYQYREQLYLLVNFSTSKISDQRLTASIAHLYEFSYQTPITSDILEEHGQAIMESDALAQLREFF